MADKSKIEWTDATWNPLRGCSRVSEGCRHCYAEGVAARFSGPGQPYEGLAKWVEVRTGSPKRLGAGGGAAGEQSAGAKREPRWTGKVAFSGDEVLTQPLRWKKPRKIFVNSMSDLFHEDVPDEWIDRIFAVMALCPQHTFQVLTKRPERMKAYLAARTAGDPWVEAADYLANALEIADHPAVLEPRDMPLPNVWLGVSVEDQVTANTRIPYLLQTPAAVRFLSCEPLLGPIDMAKSWQFQDGKLERAIPAIDWVIAGGESGPDARPMHPHWARSLRDQCAAAEVAFFFKQWGEFAPLDSFSDAEPDGNVYRVGKRAAGRLLDGIEHNGMPGAPA